ncbi:MAG: SURF1 family protein [Anaerolineales bacterium]|jgi:surfeit locus 1 family protein|uniref:SURF1 family protein n=1 Tax=Candidatus Villigracilis vicinus TaxID=3140679 RepID=UPI0031354D35|nr:SURF1 family protein [Anaerolineales bacterium]
MTVLRKMFSWKWALTTLLVFAGTAVCIRLGIWQLDRLEGRRAFNTQVETMRAASPLDLTTETPADISSMEWRAVSVTGEYDFENQMAMRNQYNEGMYGFHLITPLLYNGGAVLVNRGWIPAESDSLPEDWRVYDETGQVTVTGQVRLGKGKPAFGGVADALPLDGTRLDIWNNLDVERMSAQLPYPILGVFIQPNVEVGDTIPPIPYQPIIELTEGSHFGYALQWFTFATILFVGYPFYLQKQDD